MSNELKDLDARSFGPLFDFRADETKREALKAVQDSFPEVEAKILDLLREHGEQTDAELCWRLGFGTDRSRMTKQRHLLCEKTLIVKGDVKINPKTHIRNQSWRLA